MSLSRFFRAAVAKVLAENKQTLEKTEVWKPMLQYKLKRKETPPGAPPQYEELGGELVSVPRNHYVPKPFEAASEILRCWQAFDSDENGLVDRVWTLLSARSRPSRCVFLNVRKFALMPLLTGRVCEVFLAFGREECVQV
mgnify:CR=1 FL=1